MLSNQRSYLNVMFAGLAIMLVNMTVCPESYAGDQEKNAKRQPMQIEIVNIGVRKEAFFTMDLRDSGTLFGIDGHRIETTKLKQFLSNPDLLNKSNELVINLRIGDRKASLEEFANALRIIHDSILDRRTLVYVYLPIKQPWSKVIPKRP